MGPFRIVAGDAGRCFARFTPPPLNGHNVDVFQNIFAMFNGFEVIPLGGWVGADEAATGTDLSGGFQSQFESIVDGFPLWVGRHFLAEAGVVFCLLVVIVGDGLVRHLCSQRPINFADCAQLNDFGARVGDWWHEFGGRR